MHFLFVVWYNFQTVPSQGKYRKLTMDVQQLATLRESLKDCRQRALSSFISQFVDCIYSQGFTLEDVLLAIADYCLLKNMSDMPDVLTKAAEIAQEYEQKG